MWKSFKSPSEYILFFELEDTFVCWGALIFNTGAVPPILFSDSYFLAREGHPWGALSCAIRAATGTPGRASGTRWDDSAALQPVYLGTAPHPPRASPPREWKKHVQFIDQFKDKEHTGSSASFLVRKIVLYIGKLCTSTRVLLLSEDWFRISSYFSLWLGCDVFASLVCCLPLPKTSLQCLKSFKGWSVPAVRRGVRFPLSVGKKANTRKLFWMENLIFRKCCEFYTAFQYLIFPSTVTVFSLSTIGCRVFAKWAFQFGGKKIRRKGRFPLVQSHY